MEKIHKLDLARTFYEKQAIKEDWSFREMNWQTVDSQWTAPLPLIEK